MGRRAGTATTACWGITTGSGNGKGAITTSSTSAIPTAATTAATTDTAATAAATAAWHHVLMQLELVPKEGGDVAEVPAHLGEHVDHDVALESVG
jgi:hypothetical protein